MIPLNCEHFSGPHSGFRDDRGYTREQGVSMVQVRSLLFMAYDPHVPWPFREELDVRAFGKVAHPDAPVEKCSETGEVSIESRVRAFL